MAESRRCPECGGALPGDAPGGLCPACLLGAAFSETLEHRPGGATGRAAAAPLATPPYAEFRGLLLRLGLAGPSDLEGLEAGAGGDVTHLAQALIRAGKVTPYQAGALVQGKARGLLIGRYLILEKLGQGGMGVVFKARHRGTGQVVALKILPPSFGREEGAVRRFRREFQVASHLDHPNLVAAIEADEDRGVHFLTMDYIVGRDLETLVEEDGPMAVKLALHCCIQVARGLEAAHAQGVIHRDVKPSNVMIDAAGNVRVLDLGLAKILEATSDLAREAGVSITQTGAYMGSVDFLAPEQADNAKRADHRADVYSLGCTLYFLLTGLPPFPGDTLLKRLIAHQNLPAPSLRAARPQVSERLEAIFRWMMAKRPDDRPSSMTEVIAALEACRSSPREAGDASSDLKAFATTFMKRAAPRRRDRDPSVFGRPAEFKGLRFDPDLRLEDVIGDSKAELGHGELPEEKLPPRPTRRLGPLPRPRRRRNDAVVLSIAAFMLAALALVVFAVRPRPGSVPPKPPATGTPPSTANRPESPRPPSPPAPLAATPEPPRFVPLFNGRDLDGWRGDTADFQVRDGLLSCKPGKRAVIYDPVERTDFVARVEFRLSPGAESGLLIRYPGRGDTGYDSMCEIQILDDTHPAYADLDARLYHGSAYGIAAARRGHMKPLGEWNVQEVTVRGSTVTVELNGVVILDADLGPIRDFAGDRPHPGKDRTAGFLGIQSGVGQDRGPVEYRSVEIRDLPPPPGRPASPVPALAPVAGPPDPSRDTLVYLDDFSDPAGGWRIEDLPVEGGGAPYRKGYDDGVYFMEAPEAWTSWEAWDITPMLQAEYEVEAVARSIGPEDAYGSFGIFVVGADGRGFNVGINPGGLIGVYGSPWADQADHHFEPFAHPAVKGGGQWNTLTLRVRRRSLEVLVNGERVCEPIAVAYDLLPSTPELAIGKGDASRVRAEFDRLAIRFLDRGGSPPVDDDGRVLNLGFEDGTLRDWDAEGDAFAGPPVEGDAVFDRRGDMRSGHAGRYWVGTFEHGGDEATGTLTSVPFRVAQPYATFLLGGGADDRLRAELALKDGPVIASARPPGVPGNGWETMQPTPGPIDLSDHLGREIVLRLVDASSDGWGHLNFDDFRFHPRPPETEPAGLAKGSLVRYTDDFDQPLTGWPRGPLDPAGDIAGEYRDGRYAVDAGPGWSGVQPVLPMERFDHDFQVEVVGRVVADDPDAPGDWGIVVGDADGRGVRVYLDRRHGLNVVPSNHGSDSFPVEQANHPAIRPADAWNTLTLRIRRRAVEVLVNGESVREPVTLDFDLLPASASFALGRSPLEPSPDADTPLRAEFERVQLRTLVAE